MALIPDSLSAVAGWLRCPVCRAGFSVDGHRMRCRAGHSFDVARQGYVNLTRSSAPANADSPAMVAARARFLGLGHYAPIAAAVDSAVGDSSRLVEVGAGTGYYLARSLDTRPTAQGLATDVSPAAARRAAKAHPRLAAVVADTWSGLPIRDGVVDALLCVFAPRNPQEFARVLAPGGRVVVAVPGPDHLTELRAAHDLLGIGAEKLEDLRVSFAPLGLRLVDQAVVRGKLPLDAAAVTDLVGMGPNAFHRAVVEANPLEVTLDVTVARIQRELS